MVSCMNGDGIAPWGPPGLQGHSGEPHPRLGSVDPPCCVLDVPDFFALLNLSSLSEEPSAEGRNRCRRFSIPNSAGSVLVA